MSLKTIALAVSAAAAAAVAAVAACGDGPVTTVVRRTENTWAIAQGAGVLPLVVTGQPAEGAHPAVEDVTLQAVRAAMTWTATPPVMLAAAADGAALSGIHLVFAFNGESGGNACAGAWPAGAAPQPDGRVTLLAVLCDGGEWLARVDGRLAKSRGLDDSGLRKLIMQATRDLLAPPPAPRP